MTSFLFGGGVIFHFTGQIFQAMGHLGSFGNVAMENPAFWWYLPGKMGIFMGYVSFREGIYESLPDFLGLYIQTIHVRCCWHAPRCFVLSPRWEPKDTSSASRGESPTPGRIHGVSLNTWNTKSEVEGRASESTISQKKHVESLPF